MVNGSNHWSTLALSIHFEAFFGAESEFGQRVEGCGAICAAPNLIRVLIAGE